MMPQGIIRNSLVDASRLIDITRADPQWGAETKGFNDTLKYLQLSKKNTCLLNLDELLI